MNFNDTTLHKRVVTARVTQNELMTIAAAHLAARAGVDLHLTSATVTRAHITNVNPGSLNATEYALDMTIEVDLDQPEGTAPALQDIEEAFAKGVLK